LINLAKSGNEAAVEALSHRDRIDGGNRTSALLPKTPDVYDKVEDAKNNTMSPAVLNNASSASAEDFPDDFDGVVVPRGGFESLGYVRHPVTNKWVK
jgi:putative intracellular protease/amidase